MLPAPEDILMPHPAMAACYDPRVRAEMMVFEMSGGGAIFATGSVNWTGALPANGFVDDAATVTANVLARFLDPEPSILPGGD